MWAFRIRRRYAVCGHELAMDRVSSFVRNYREVFESSVIAAVEQHAGAAGVSDREATGVAVGRASGHDVSAPVGGIEQGIECGLVLLAQPRECFVKNAPNFRERSYRRGKPWCRSRQVPLAPGLMIVSLNILQPNLFVALDSISMLRH